MNQTSKNKQASNANKPSNNQQQSIKTQINIPKQNTRSDYTATMSTKQTFPKITCGNNLQIPQQHSSNQPIHIINAPTSLTNLAQFSGITILPIGNISSDVIHGKQILPCNMLPNVSLHQVSPPSRNHYQQHQGPVAHTGNQANLQKTKTANQTGIIGSSNQQPIYNLASTPSVQLLSQNSIDYEPNHWSDASMSTSKSRYNLQKTQSNISTSINSRVNSRRNKTENNLADLHSFPDDMQVIPISDGLPLLAEVSDMQPTRSSGGFDNISRQSSGSSTGDKYCVDVNGDNNNISLMKLIAILNNPALTVTAVNNRNSNTNLNQSTGPDYRQSTSTDLNDCQLFGSSNGLPRHTSQPREDYFSQAMLIDEKQMRAELLATKNRVPQSAANLRVMHKDSANCFSTHLKHNHLSSITTNSDTSNCDNLTTKDLSKSPISCNHKHSDIELNWLPEYTSLSSAGNSMTASIFRVDSSVPKGTENSYSYDRQNDPTLLSTSVRNLMMQQLPSSTKQQAVSVQLLKHIANQTKDNAWASDQAQKSILEPECVLNVPRSIQQLSAGAKRIESYHTVTSSAAMRKAPKEPILSTKDRLYIPEARHVQHEKKEVKPNFSLSRINLERGEERLVYVSERHSMLESMMSNINRNSNKSAIPEPDEIFINRSKRIMSKIDTMIERKKRRRFERISGRSAPKTSSLEDQLAESENEWSDDENRDLDYSGFIKTQLPLEEIETDEKKNHLRSVGLVSRYQRNQLMVEECQRKSLVLTPLALENPNGVSEEIRRFVATILKTGGTDVQLRTESNIKRNDLPLIEGLNRNTSRMKMHYMNVLGLEKRSKRTTLYKVKQTENSNSSSTKSTDLNKIKSASLEKQKSDFKPDAPVNNLVDKPAMSAPILLPRLTITTCRDVVKPPNKYEYMKSLGLMAS